MKRAQILAVFATVFFLMTTVNAENFFTSCRFHWGSYSRSSSYMPEVDYLGAWAGSGDPSVFNLGSFFTSCKSNDKTPFVVVYIIAFAARYDWGLQDCNVDTVNNLCLEGANYMRQQRARIMSVTQIYSKGAAQYYGTDKPIVWIMEPDYVQYSETGSSTQHGGGYPFDSCGMFMAEMMDTLQKYNPKSVFSFNISCWFDTTWQKNWFSNFPMNRVSLMYVGQANPTSNYIGGSRSSFPTYNWVLKTYHTPMHADAGYGVAGASTGYDTVWDKVTTLNARIPQGVIGVCHSSTPTDWATLIAAMRPQLVAPPPECYLPDPTSVVPFSMGRRLDSPEGDLPGTIEVFDLSGRIVGRISSGSRNSDLYGVLKLPQGIWISRLKAQGKVMKIYK